MLIWLELVGTEVVGVKETAVSGSSDCLVVPFEARVLEMTVRSLDVLFGSRPDRLCSSKGIAMPDDVPLLESKVVTSSSLTAAF